MITFKETHPGYTFPQREFAPVMGTSMLIEALEEIKEPGTRNCMSDIISTRVGGDLTLTSELGFKITAQLASTKDPAIGAIYIDMYNPVFKEKQGEGLGKINLTILMPVDRWRNCITEFGPWILGDDELAMLYNQSIRQEILKVRTIYLRLKTSQTYEPSCRQVFDAYRAPQRVTLLKAIQEYMYIQVPDGNGGHKDKASKSTKTIYNSMGGAVSAMLAKDGKKDIFLDDIDHVFFYNFEMYMARSLSPNGRSYEKSTMVKYIEKLKAIMAYAFKVGYIKTEPAARYKMGSIVGVIPKNQEFDRWKLSQDQLQRLEMFPLTGLSEAGMADLPRIRLIFLLQTWIGFAWKDFVTYGANMQKLIRNDFSGRPCIVYNRAKNGELAIVPIFEQTRQLLEALKYDCSPGCSYTVFAGKYARLWMRYELKINEDDRGTHLGRHIFGMRMLSMGFSLEAVSRMMGHTSIKETERVYAQIDVHKVTADFEVIQAVYNQNSNPIHV